ncbi:hypothetical protein [Pseudorhodoferax soli]|uniref:Tetratricopeptide repeat protein n=1 Tax=Pseudorhodoferax soli TaxID=545864 RepID=A0A368XPU0_9BURK|nr:hypothetical protein [Pseudorhodoferax soli]RCW68034.1 hypothetical protein DES41_108211 [Pseudorhodoferax soli]
MPMLRETLALLHAGRWTEAHNLVQDDGSPLAAWLHGILHIQEGDLEDAEYWYGNASRHFRSRGTLQEELALFEAGLPASADPTLGTPPGTSACHPR